jgi:hypothetical protein
MKAINATAQATLTKILSSVFGAELGACGRIGEEGEGFMPVCTARLGESLYSVGHYIAAQQRGRL